MKHFIKKGLLFLIVLLIPIALLAIVINSNSRKVVSKMESYSKFLVLIMGDSQMQRINPEDFTNNVAENFASLGEHYYFTFQKLKLITDINDNKLERIVIGVSPHNFSPIYSKLFDPSTSQGASSIKRYYYFIQGNDFVNNFDILKYKHLINIIDAKPDWGGFYKSTKSKLDTITINRVLKMHFEGNIEKNSNSQEKYLDKIVELCISKNIDLTFVATPYHPYYKKNIDEYYLTKYNSIISKYPNINYLNYMNDSINLEWMSDGNHLSFKGSNVYSKKINDAIELRKNK